MVLVAYGCSTAQAATVAMVHGNVGDEDWNEAQDSDLNFFWSNNAAAGAGNDYVISSLLARTTYSVSSTFNGDSLTLRSGGSLAMRQQDGNTATVDLIIDGGILDVYMPGTQHFDGTLHVTAATGIIDLNRAGRNIVLDTGVTGTGILHIRQGAIPGGPGSSILTLNHDSSFSGTWRLLNGTRIEAVASGSLGQSNILVDHENARFDPQYAMADVASLTINSGGMILRDVAHTFGVGDVTLLGNVLPLGTYTGTELNIFAGGTVVVADFGGTLTVGNRLPPEPVFIGSRKQLFLDPARISERAGIALNVNRPVKDPTPVLVADEPWESRTLIQYGSAFKDGDVYKMWYRIWGPEPGFVTYVGYATSPDGVNWSKPNVGSVVFNGSDVNNLVFSDSATEGEVSSVTVNTNPAAPPGQRYLAYRSNVSELWVHTSADGLNFVPLGEEPSYERSDTNQVLFWDERLKRYVGYVRGWEIVRGVNSRVVRRVEFDDLQDWGEGQAVLTTDSSDPINMDVYNSAAVKYEGVYLMFPSLYTHTPAPPNNDGTLEVHFAVSRDGIAWNRPDRSPFVPLGPDGEWDDSQIYIFTGLIMTDTEVWMYYMGEDFTHAEGEDVSYGGGVGRLRLRRDGFMSADTTDDGGELTTVPLIFTGNQLELNVDTGESGSLRVALRRADGSPIPGFSLGDSDTIGGDFINKTVSWGGSKTLSALAGTPICLQFEMDGAVQLYSFMFNLSPPNSGTFFTVR